MPSAWAANLLSAGVTVVAAALFLVASRACWLTRSARLVWISAGFLFFLAKGVLASVALFARPDWAQVIVVPSLFLDLLILVAFYMAVLRRSPA